MGKDWVEHWLDPDDDLKEVEVDPDVFYDYFLSIPTVKCQRHFKEYKTQFLAKIQNGTAEEFAKEVGRPDDLGLQAKFQGWIDTHKEWKKENLNWSEAKASKNAEKEKMLARKVRELEASLTSSIRDHFDQVRNASYLFVSEHSVTLVNSADPSLGCVRYNFHQVFLGYSRQRCRRFHDLCYHEHNYLLRFAWPTASS
jgi:hypothetical protein